jgi:hypothetical protein
MLPLDNIKVLNMKKFRLTAKQERISVYLKSVEKYILMAELKIFIQEVQF